MKTHATQEPWWKSRTLMTFIAIGIMWGIWERAEVMLNHLDATKAVSFESLTQTVLWTMTVLVFSLSGVKCIEKMMSFRREAASSTVNALEQVIDRTPAPKHFDDDTV